VKLLPGVEKISNSSSLIRVSPSLSSLLIFVKALQTIHRLLIVLCQQQSLACAVKTCWRLSPLFSILACLQHPGTSLRCSRPPGTAH